MIDGTYQICLRTPKAINDGSAVLAVSGDVLTANFSIDGVGSVRQRGTFTGDEFVVEGSTNLYLFGRVGYRINGLVAGDLLKATCATDTGTYDITGSRIA